ncbi:MAG: hypothetical protein PHG11_09050, partial [Eubacteriales bacterium]|nr:hypothetical protein [Eubacteriales bacterium]
MSVRSGSGKSRITVDISVPTGKRTPWGPVLLKWLCWLAGVMTMGVLMLIVLYILVNCVPEFFFRDENGALQFKDQL